jgi:hypothetical protein
MGQGDQVRGHRSRIVEIFPDHQMIGGSQKFARRSREAPMELFDRKQFLHLAASAAAVPVASRIARAQTYPTKPVRIVVPVAAGGSKDVTARLIGQWLSEHLGQQFLIENRPGGGGNIGTEAVLRAAPGRLRAPYGDFEQRGKCFALREAQLRFHTGCRAMVAVIGPGLPAPGLMMVPPETPAMR